MITKSFFAQLINLIRNETRLSDVLLMDLLILNLNGTSHSTDEPKIYLMSMPIQVMWITMFLFVALVGAIGNLIVIWIVLAHQNMRTVANLFIVNLALADALASIFNVPVTSYGEIFLNWPFGAFYCKFNEGIASVSVCVSVITLAILSIERYTVIIMPFKPRMRRATALKSILVTWCVSLIITVPQWYFVEVGTLVYTKEEITLCLSVWSEMKFGEFLKSIYSFIFMILTYFMPLACISFTYGRVAMHLWGAKAIGEVTKSQLKQKQAKQKVVKMMIVVVIAFAICWMPLHLYFIFMNSSMTDSPLANNIFLALFWLAMSNSMYNPMIYCWMNDKFRAGFKEVFQCCLCRFPLQSDQTEIKL